MAKKISELPAAAALAAADLLELVQGGSNRKMALSALLDWLATKASPAGLLFAKADPASPAWQVVSGLRTSQVVTVAINGTVRSFATATAVTLPALTVGRDYAIYATEDGRLVADLNWSAPAGEAAGSTRKVGGFHVALTGEILPYSLWDLHYRPSCPDPRGMVCINGAFWADIYLIGVNHHVDGTSAAGVTIASGTQPPKVPSIFGGDGSTAYSGFPWFAAQDVLQSHGKRAPSWAEFSILAFGVTEGSASGANSGTTQHDAPRRSRWGVEQATGNRWVWGADIQGVAGEAAAVSWISITGGRGAVYTGTTRAVLLGGSWQFGTYSGSRAAHWNLLPSASDVSTSARGICDHLRLG